MAARPAALSPEPAYATQEFVEMLLRRIEKLEAIVLLSKPVNQITMAMGESKRAPPPTLPRAKASLLGLPRDLLRNTLSYVAPAPKLFAEIVKLSVAAPPGEASQQSFVYDVAALSEIRWPDPFPDWKQAQALMIAASRLDPPRRVPLKVLEVPALESMKYVVEKNASTLESISLIGEESWPWKLELPALRSLAFTYRSYYVGPDYKSRLGDRTKELFSTENLDRLVRLQTLRTWRPIVWIIARNYPDRHLQSPISAVLKEIRHLAGPIVIELDPLRATESYLESGTFIDGITERIVEFLGGFPRIETLEMNVNLIGHSTVAHSAFWPAKENRTRLESQDPSDMRSLSSSVQRAYNSKYEGVRSPLTVTTLSLNVPWLS